MNSKLHHEHQEHPTLEEYLRETNREIVHYCISNGGNAELAKNLAISAKRCGIRLVFLGTDSASLKSLAGQCDVVDYREIDPYRLSMCNELPTEAVDFGTDLFARLCWLKYGALKAILHHGKTAVFLDTDVVIERNYESELTSYLGDSNFDGLIQSNHIDLPCAGFFAFSPSAKDLVDNIFNDAFITSCGYAKGYTSLGGLSDQGFWTNVVFKPTNHKPLMRLMLPPKRLYPNGNYFYENSDSIANDCRIIHFNCVKGQERKVEKMKQYGKWYL